MTGTLFDVDPSGMLFTVCTGYQILPYTVTKSNSLYLGEAFCHITLGGD